MAIITKDGFDFFDDLNGNPEYFLLKGKNIEQELNYIKSNKVKSIALTHSESKSVTNLDFLKEIPFVKQIVLNDLEIDYSGLYHLVKLISIRASVKNKKQHLVFNHFKHLEQISIDWYIGFPSLVGNNHLISLSLWGYKPKSKSFSDLELPSSLKFLEIIQSNIENLKGFSSLALSKFEAHYCRNLLSLSGIEQFRATLQELILGSCANLTEYEYLGACEHLNKLIISKSGEIPSLSWVRELHHLSHFTFMGTKIKDGNLAPLLGIKYVYFTKATHYSHTLKEIEISGL